MLHTNNTGVCSQYLSHTGPAPAHGAHSSGSRLVRWEPSEAGPGVTAPPRSKPLRLRHSGSPQRRRLGWACVLCPSQVRATWVFGECGCYDLLPFPSLLLSFLGVQLAPFLRQMMTVQNPKKSQLAKKLACSLEVNVSLGLRLPPSGLSSSGCLSPERNGLQPANSVPSFVLCAVLVVSYFRAFRVVAIPQSGMLAQVTLWFHLQHSSLILKKDCSPRLPAQPPLASGGCKNLCCFSAGGVTVGLVICWFYLFIYFSSLLCCPLCFQGSPQTLQRDCFLVFGNFYLFKTPFPGQSSLPTSFVSFFIFYFFPTCF